MPVHPDLLQKIQDNDPSVTMIHIIRAYPPLNAKDMNELAEAAQGNTHLKALLLYENSIGDEGCLYLSQLTQIETLALSNNNITDVGAIHLARMPNLKSLTITNNKIGDQGFSALMNHPRLEKLIISENESISDQVAQLVLKNSTLTCFIFDSSNPTLQKEINHHIKTNHTKNTASSQEPTHQPTTTVEPVKTNVLLSSERLSLFSLRETRLYPSKASTNALLELKKNAILTYANTQIATLNSLEERQQLKEMILKEINHLGIPLKKQTNEAYHLKDSLT